MYTFGDGRVVQTSPVTRSLYPSHCLGVVLSCPHWLIWISGSWEFVLTAEGWGNGPFITLMEEYWLWCRSTIPVCNSNGLPEKSQMKRHRGISRKRETPLRWLLAPYYLFMCKCVCQHFLLMRPDREKSTNTLLKGHHRKPICSHLHIVISCHAESLFYLSRFRDISL